MPGRSDGYAVLTYTARGLWGSCGTPEARAANPVACAAGYIHLADVRYEVRDTQDADRPAGRRAASRTPRRIGVTGDSYGGGQSLMLAALRDRVMLPDGRLVPWRSPDGTPLQLAAAAPVIPWTDLVYAAAPNGRTLADGDHAAPSARDDAGRRREGHRSSTRSSPRRSSRPARASRSASRSCPGRPMGFLAPPGLDPDADVAGWVGADRRGRAVRRRERNADRRPARALPLAPTTSTRQPARRRRCSSRSGFTDDLFPVDEALRFANRTRARYPQAADLAAARRLRPPARRRTSRGAQRGCRRSIHAWFDHYLRGQRPPAPQRASSRFAQTCPRSAPSRGPFRARPSRRSRAARCAATRPSRRRLTSAGGDPRDRRGARPGSGRRRRLRRGPARSREPGTADLLACRHGQRGFTLLGAPAVRRADLGQRSQAGRRPDRRAAVGRGPGRRQRRLVARGLLPAAARPAPALRSSTRARGASRPGTRRARAARRRPARTPGPRTRAFRST